MIVFFRGAVNYYEDYFNIPDFGGADGSVYVTYIACSGGNDIMDYCYLEWSDSYHDCMYGEQGVQCHPGTQVQVLPVLRRSFRDEQCLFEC